MVNSYTSLLKHGAVYGGGYLIARLASVVLLPFYTGHLSPEDYGIVALLDVVAALLSTIIGSGIAGAAARLHFDDDTPLHRAQVWWTAATVIIVTATCLVLPGIVIRDALTGLLFSSDIVSDPAYVLLLLLTVWFGAVEQFTFVFLRVQGASLQFVAISLGRLLLNIGLNVYLIGTLGMGVRGLLLGNLLATVAAAVVLAALLRHRLGLFRFHPALAHQLWAFGWPLMVSGVLSLAMHQLDRYLLLFLADLKDVGIYSLAYQIGQGVMALVVLPFFLVWDIQVYELAKRPDAKERYAIVFEYFFYAVALIGLALAVTAEWMIAYVAPPQYGPAAQIIPVVSLAYLFFYLHGHFKVPALLAKRTVAMLPSYTAAATLNGALILLLVPPFGAIGAAWASVGAFLLFAGLGYWRYRKIDEIPYPLRRCAAVLTGMIITVACLYFLRTAGHSHLLFGILLWTLWAAALAFVTAREMIRDKEVEAVVVQ